VAVNNDDYSFYLYSSGPHYGVGDPVFLHVSELEGKQGFSSLYGVTESTAKAISAAGTCKGFKGVVWSDKLWLDVDGYDKCEAVEQRLKEMGYEYKAYDTGGRGGHFSIELIPNPSHLLPQQSKQYVQEHFPECDSTIYTHLHPFRLVGTTHSNTGRTKFRVGGEDGKALRLPEYVGRESTRVGGDFGSTTNSASIFDNFFIQRNTQEIPKQGERHAQLVRLCYALRDSGYDINLARWWVSEANKRWAPPKEDHEIEKALSSIYR
jgi:hypothetical protein